MKIEFVGGKSGCLFLASACVGLAAIFWLSRDPSPGVLRTVVQIAVLFCGAVITCTGIYWAIRSQFFDKPKSPQQVMQSLRQKWLTTPPDSIGVKDYTDEWGIYAVVMDVNMGEHTFTVLAALGGDASLYTTKSFGIIGGMQYESVRDAARKFCYEAEKYMSQFQKTTSYPYPEPHWVTFYILTRNGVFHAAIQRQEIESHPYRLYPLYACGYNVITQLRLVTSNTASQTEP